MRTLFLSIVLIGIIVAILLLWPMASLTQTPGPTPPTPTLSSAPPENSADLETYRVAWTIADPKDVTLIPNFTQKRTARALIDNNECSEIVNAGFYTKDNQPTGLFIANGKTIREHIPNTFLNGYLVIDQNNTVSIRSSPPEAPVRIALQSGPILMRNGNPLPLSIRDDEFARRVVVAVDRQGNVVFLAVYDPENPYEGPKLADLPTVLNEVRSRLDILDAINLDGGSASTFIRDDLSLEELTSVGSFFCVR